MQIVLDIDNFINKSPSEIQNNFMELINTPMMAQFAINLYQNMSYIVAKQETKFWKLLNDKLTDKLDKQWDISFDGYLFYDANHDILPEDEIVLNIMKDRATTNVGAGIVLEYQKIQFYIKCYNHKNLSFYIKGFENPNRNNSYDIDRDSKYNVSFDIKLHTFNHDIFDNTKLEKIIENIVDEIIYYLGLMT